MGESPWLDARDEGASALLQGMSQRGSLNLKKAKQSMKEPEGSD